MSGNNFNLAGGSPEYFSPPDHWDPQDLVQFSLERLITTINERWTHIGLPRIFEAFMNWMETHRVNVTGETELVSQPLLCLTCQMALMRVHVPLLWHQRSK